MKKIIVFATLLFCIFFCGCNEKKEEIQKTDIDFEENSFAESSCQWAIHDNDMNGKVLIINSDEDLKNYITCGNSNYPAVDFSKYTILYAQDVTTSGVSNISKKFQQFTDNEYNLYIDVTLNMTAVAQGWSTSIRVKKLSQNAIVKLTENIHH